MEQTSVRGEQKPSPLVAYGAQPSCALGLPSLTDCHCKAQRRQTAGQNVPAFDRDRSKRSWSPLGTQGHLPAMSEHGETCFLYHIRGRKPTPWFLPTGKSLKKKMFCTDLTAFFLTCCQDRSTLLLLRFSSVHFSHPPVKHLFQLLLAMCFSSCRCMNWMAPGTINRGPWQPIGK